MFIKDVPGHRTDSMGVVPPEKTSITARVLNKSKIPVNLRGATIKPGKEGNVRNWNIIQHDDVVRQWLSAKAIEVISETEVTPTPPEPPPTEGTDAPTREQSRRRSRAEGAPE